MSPEKRALLFTLMTIACGCFGLVSLIAAPISWMSRASAAELLQSGATVQATVQRLSQQEGAAGRTVTRRTGTTRFVVVEFTTLDGKAQRATADRFISASEFGALREGSSVAIVYPKNRPYEVYLKDSLVRTQASSTYLLLAVVAVVGIVGCIVGLKMGASIIPPRRS